MTDPRRERDGGTLDSGDQPRKAAQRHRSRTEGTDRDFDDSGESVNQGHGHPREQREGDSGGAGRQDRRG